jgi:serine/threonine protein kinase
VPSLSTSRSRECPDEESLWHYAEGKLVGNGLEAVRAHLQNCSICRAGIASFGTSSSAPVESSPPSEAPPFDAMPRELDGRYHLEEELGRGASATVYGAMDTRLGEKVALKVFRSGLGEKVAQELLIARRVSHPNVCRVYDAGVVSGAAYLSMELVSGETLAVRMAKHGNAPDADADTLLRAILSGLSAAHDAGVIHRDLKPQNILVEPSGRVVITDFGLARMADEEESRARLVGTPSTWSPEQARGEPATFASDVYSFGVIAYRLLTGRPFRVSDPAPFDVVPPAYRRILRRTLALSPTERAGTANEVLALMRKAERPHAFARFLMAAAFVALVVLAVGIWVVSKRGGTPNSVEPSTGATLPAAPAVKEPSAGPSVWPMTSPLVPSAPRASTTPSAPVPHGRPLPRASSSSWTPLVPSSAPKASDLLFGQ